MKRQITVILFGLLAFFSESFSQHSVAREWNEVLLEAIRNDYARPTVHARNLWHTSIIMYDAWAVYDSASKTFFLGDSLGNHYTPFTGVPLPTNIQDAQEEAMSYAAYRLLKHRFKNSPGSNVSMKLIDSLFVNDLGYDSAYHSTTYSNGNPAALGNYLAAQIIAFGMQDGANEQNDYANLYYNTYNPTLVPVVPGNPDIIDPNRWQALTLDVFIDQSGNVIPLTTPPFLSPEWGEVVPFALNDSDKTVYNKAGYNWHVFHDPGLPALMDTATAGGTTADYQWGHSLVAVWSGHLDPDDTLMWDISPASIGNIPVNSYPTTIAGLQSFYNYTNGGDIGTGHTINPSTGMPYAPQMRKRSDYARVLAEFWADGPDSETPPGHWFTILNQVNDHVQSTRKWEGVGVDRSDLEWDVKTYFTLSGTVHDAAVAAWGIKGYYDYVRPISAIRYMADQGQSSDSTKASYSPLGIPLTPGYVELVDSNDVLAGGSYENVGKIKLYAWAGPDSIGNPATDYAGVSWILAENWWPYQRPTFVTPPFAGYVSGHSTFSRAAAEVMTSMTGDAFFPGGMGEFLCAKDEFLVFEDGPSDTLILQWATYRDASDQCSLSRIWGGIHPPVDDIPGRLIGIEIGNDAFAYADKYFDCPKPTVVTVSTSSDPITDADTGTATFSIAIDFSTAMDTVIDPMLSFSNMNADPLNSTLFFNAGQSGWNSLMQYVAVYDVVDVDTNMSGIVVQVIGGKDVAGAFQIPFDSTNIFTIDTRNPICIGINANLLTISDPDSGAGQFLLTMTYDEAMDTAGVPMVSFPVEDPLAMTLSANAGLSTWLNTLQYQFVFDVADSNEVLADIDVRITLGTDVNGNVQVVEDSMDMFSIEMENPIVDSLAISHLALTGQDTGEAAFSIYAKFSEPLDTSSMPMVSFPVENATAKTLSLNSDSTMWISTTEFLAVYDVADSSEQLPDVDVRISGIPDVHGNQVVVFDVADTFDILMHKPLVVSVTPSPILIGEPNVGTGTFTLTIEYNEPMDTNLAPVISFPVENPTANTLTLGASGWLSDTVFVAGYDVADGDETLPDIDVEVSSAQSAIGNVQLTHVVADLFDIDTEQPLVTSIIPSPVVVADSQTGTGNFTLTISFGEIMNFGAFPTITFPNEDPLAQTLTLDSSACLWSGPQQFVATFDVADSGEVLSDIDVRVANSTDVAGNPLVQYDEADVFDIEMENPEVVKVIPSPSTIQEIDTGNATFSLTVIYTEDMDANAAPVITFPMEDPSATISKDSAASGWLNATTYEAVYDVAHSGDTILDIDVFVSNGKDVVGNDLVSFSDSNNFNIQMKALVGIHDQILETVLVYPNPTSDYVSLEFEKPYDKDMEIMLFDAKGSQVVVNEERLGAKSVKLDVSGQADGTYILHLNNADRIYTTNIVLSR